MQIQNTKDFQNFIVNQEITDREAKNIEQIIGAFSEYIVAVNPDYVYNKTYLSAYVEEFILCQKALKLKYQILISKIFSKITSAGVINECIINVDGAWICERGRIKLNNTIDPYYVIKDKMQIEIEWMHDNGFVIAEEINIKEDYEKVLDECISIFVKQRKEFLEHEV